MSKAKWTNGSGLALAYGCSRQYANHVLANGDIPAAVPPSKKHGKKTCWRVPVHAVNRWILSRGQPAPRWVKVEKTGGRWSDVWVPVR